MNTSNIQNIAIERIHPHPDNPRKDLGDLTELAESIKVNGVYQNLTVVPGIGDDFVAVIGHRRLAAAKLAGLTEVPCAVVEMTPEEQIKTMLVENMQRSDLTIYEQAQGFQLMLDMGGTVESVAKDTGFSVSTVRKRVKMTELDQGKLRKAVNDADRRIRLEDFDELAKIEDIKARNKALADIGTNNFQYSVRTAIQQQEKTRRKPLAMKWLTAAGAKKIKRDDTYGSKYDQVGAYSYLFSAWDEADMPDVSKLPDGLFYCLSGMTDGIRLFTKAKKKPKEKKSKKQTERERQIAAAWEPIDAAARTAYELRRAFVNGVATGRKNKEAVLTGAVYAMLLNAVDYNSPDRDWICAMLGLDTKGYDPDRMMKAWRAYAKADPTDMAKLVYAFFEDSERAICAKYNRSERPQYKHSAKLEMLYDWLDSLGYVMSDAEAAMLNGTLAAYEKPDGGDGDKKEASGA